jgi:hypothetical protein
MILDRSRKFVLYVVIWLFLCGQVAWAEDDDNKVEVERYKWFLTVYAGAHAQDDIGDIFSLKPKFEDNDYLVVAALAREFWHYKHYFGLEVEGQVGKHFNNDSFWEFNGVLVGRWHAFPWNKYVDTSFAVGDGISVYTEVSKVEEEDDEDAGQVLNYLMFELALGLPRFPQWDLVLRIHHRSSVFGLAGSAGSNYLCGGIKFSF